METEKVFPLDASGTACKTIRPSWIVAKAAVDEFQGEEFCFATPVS